MTTYLMAKAPWTSTEARKYKSRRSAETYARRHGLTIVDSHPDRDPPPAGSDARAWDAYRTRHGYAGG